MLTYGVAGVCYNKRSPESGGFAVKRSGKSGPSNQSAFQERSRRRADNEARYDELLDRAMRRRQYEKRYGRDDY